MQLSRSSLNTIADNKKSISIPSSTTFNLPEKVLQFGTGVLLRGLPDYFINKANNEGVFNGRVVVVKSTDKGDIDIFKQQDNLYTICIRGIEDEQLIEENIISTAISRVLSSSNNWQEILSCAKNPELKIVISNTTEVGIELLNGDKVSCTPPKSFPVKLLAFLFERFKHFKGTKESGMVIVATEQIVNNGDTLKSLVLEQAINNELSDEFIDWLKTSNYFCNSLVDRIIPGIPSQDKKQTIESELGYQDDLLTLSESYHLWAIQDCDHANCDHVKSILSFSQTDEQVIITPNIDRFRELKLRILNGTHTFTCGLAFLSGIKFVKEAMKVSSMEKFISDLMLEEIAISIPYEIKKEEAMDFGQKVLDRFRNPMIEHQWINITVQYTSKMKSRNVPLIKKYCESNTMPPENMSLGFAAYLLFMKSTRDNDGKYYGKNNGEKYLIDDVFAENLSIKWDGFEKQKNINNFVKGVLADKNLWGEDLSALEGFSVKVAENLASLMKV